MLTVLFMLELMMVNSDVSKFIKYMSMPKMSAELMQIMGGLMAVKCIIVAFLGAM